MAIVFEIMSRAQRIEPDCLLVIGEPSEAVLQTAMPACAGRTSLVSQRENAVGRVQPNESDAVRRAARPGRDGGRGRALDRQVDVVDGVLAVEQHADLIAGMGAVDLCTLPW
jgi:hypothetical protein